MLCTSFLRLIIYSSISKSIKYLVKLVKELDTNTINNNSVASTETITANDNYRNRVV